MLQWGRTRDGIAALCSLFLENKHLYELCMAPQTHCLRTQNQSHRGLLLEMIAALNQEIQFVRKKEEKEKNKQEGYKGLSNELIIGLETYKESGD